MLRLIDLLTYLTHRCDFLWSAFLSELISDPFFFLVIRWIQQESPVGRERKGAKDSIFCTLPYIYRSTTSIWETYNRIICVDFVELDLFTLPLPPSSWRDFQEAAIKHFDPNNYSSTFLTRKWEYMLRGKRSCICLNIYRNGKNH